LNNATEGREGRPEPNRGQMRGAEREDLLAEDDMAYGDEPLAADPASEEDEAEERAYFERKARMRKRMKNAIVICVILALLVNVLSFWPMLYNAQAIRFLAVSRELSRDEAVSQYKQAVVNVTTESGRGTGFLISADGYIVTNDHVVGGKKEVFVRFSKGTSHVARVVASDADLDLAVLKVELSGEDDRYALPVERERSWKTGTPVYVIGNPLLFDRIANKGAVIGEVPVQGLSVPAMALDAPIYKGNSGSPVIDEQGKVIAVVFATTRIELEGQSRTVGLAVPASGLLAMLDKLGVAAD
jgi:serine protease Do